MKQVLKTLGVSLIASSCIHLTAQTSPHYLITNDDNPFGNTASFYTVGTNGKLTYKTTVATGGVGSQGQFAAGHSMLVTQVGTENCAFLPNNGSNDISGIDIAKLTLTGVFKGGPSDNSVSGTTLRANAQFVYRPFPVAANPGFDTEGVLLASFDPFLSGYDDNHGREFYRRLVERVATLPGIQSVSLARRLPLTLSGIAFSAVVINGYTPRADEGMRLNYETVGPNYFRTMRIPLLQGRDFDERDDGRTQGVVIISQAMAQRYWAQR